MIPTRRISSKDDLKLFQESETYNEILGFITELNENIQGCELGVSSNPSNSVNSLLGILSQVAAFVDNHPPGEVASRFGKPEFRDFYDEVSSSAKSLLKPLNLADPDEVGTYFVESFGSRERIDYGSGHELNFVCFLLCLKKLAILEDSDSKDIVLGVFYAYLQTMRRVQKAYWLEPAGSHGVWGLDDYHFLPFLFGSGQLATHRYLRPMSIHDTELVDMYKEKYMYFQCIYFINSVKTASLRWHSPMLDDISGVKRWAKVNQGMIKMYKAEVLGKLPIMQHFLFGDILKAPQGVSDPKDSKETETHSCWADCCGIRVPSAIAAHEKSTGLRMIPFD